MNTPDVLLGWQASPAEIDLVASLVPDARVRAVPAHESISPLDCDPGEMERAAKGARVMLAWTLVNELLPRFDGLGLIAWLHSGIDPIDQAALEAAGIALSNTSGSNATAVAEHAFALLLSMAKRLDERDRRVKAGEWVPLWQPETAGTLLEGGTLVVVGVGAVGTEVAKRARAFGMRVVGVRKSGQPSPAVDEVRTPERLTETLAEADAAVLCVPLTGSTRRLIGKAELAAMRPHAFLVNVCRGPVVDEPAIKAALDAGAIAGFASDVWWTYPHHLPEGWHYSVASRLGVHRHPRTLATGDHACDLMPLRDRMVAQGARNARAFLAGEAPPNLLFDGRTWLRRP